MYQRDNENMIQERWMSGGSMILKAYQTLTDFKVKYSFQYCEDGFLLWKGKTAVFILSCYENRLINSENLLCMLQSNLQGMCAWIAFT